MVTAEDFLADGHGITPWPDMPADAGADSSGGARESDPLPSEPRGEGESPAMVLLDGGPEIAVVAGPTVVRGSDPWSEAGRGIIRFHFGRMLARVPGTIDGQDPEEVHAMRVSARRIRAAWRVFGSAYDADLTRRHRRDLRTIGAHLGAVRDLDVLIAILAGYRDRRRRSERTDLEPLISAWRTERTTRHAALVDSVGSTWFADLVGAYEAFVATPGLATRELAPHVPALVRNRAPSEIWAAYQATWAYDGPLDRADLASLHEARIAAKWFRYTLEFVREPLGAGSGELIRRVVAVQDQLGDIHDLDVAAGLARAFAADGSAGSDAERAAAGRFVATLDARVERLRRRLGPAWQALVGAEYRRGLGRAIARL